MLASVFGGWEVVLILAVVLLLFGSKKLPELARGLGQGIREFKKATREVGDELNQAIEEPPQSAQQKRVAAANVQPPVEPTVPQSTPSKPS
jgi:sec-independent protein translocase protein TatA